MILIEFLRKSVFRNTQSAGIKVEADAAEDAALKVSSSLNKFILFNLICQQLQ